VEIVQINCWHLLLTQVLDQAGRQAQTTNEAVATPAPQPTRQRFFHPAVFQDEKRPWLMRVKIARNAPQNMPRVNACGLDQQRNMGVACHGKWLIDHQLDGRRIYPRRRVYPGGGRVLYIVSIIPIGQRNSRKNVLELNDGGSFMRVYSLSIRA
jgi:hypothetical protein